MNIQTLPYLTIYIVSAAISASIAIYTWQHRRVRASLPFAVVALLEASWTIGYIFELASPTLEGKIFWDNFQFIGFIFLPMAFFAFAVQYSDRPLRYQQALWTISLVVSTLFLLLVYTDEWHGLIRSASTLIAGDPFDTLTYEFTVVFYAMFVYVYLFVLIPIGILAAHIRRVQGIYRAQTITILIGVLIPLAGAVITFSGITLAGQRDITPITFALSNMVMAFGLFRYRLFDVVPVARDTLIESMPDGLLVLDAQDRLVDLNPVMQTLMGDVDRQMVVGQTAVAVFARWPDMLAKFGTMHEGQDAVVIAGDDNVEYHFRITVTPLTDQRGKFSGRLILVRDITARKQSEMALNQYREHLEDMVASRTAELQAEITERQRIEDELKLYQGQLEARVARRTEALAKATRAAEAASQAKSQFLSNMSHELRTPLNGILGYAQILQREPNLNKRQVDGLDIIEQSGQHLLMLINDVLDLSKIEAGKLELFPSTVQLPQLLRGVAGMMQMRARQKGLTFHFEMSNHLPDYVTADETRLRQVLINLVGNAIKYTNNGRVTFQIQRVANSDQIRFEVIDTGVGLTPEQQEVIFLPFERVGDVQKTEGTGLGLAITQQLVEKMGGQVQVESVPGEGSRFWFDVPMPQAGVPTPEMRQHMRQIVGYDGPTKKILVVDDRRQNQMILVHMLLPLGFEVLTAGSGEEALAVAQQDKPDLVLMDLVMPGMNGFAATVAMRQVESLHDVLIVAVSASVFEDDLAESEVAGCDGFLPKPIRQDDLLDLLTKQLQLTWRYEVADLVALPEVKEAGGVTAVGSSTITLPTAILDPLLDFARQGNMRGIRQQADHIRQLGDTYHPIADELEQLARRYEEQIILDMVQQFVPE